MRVIDRSIWGRRWGVGRTAILGLVAIGIPSLAHSQESTSDEPADLIPVGVLEGHDAPVYAVDWLLDGRIVTGSFDETLRIWDPSNGRALRVLDGHDGYILCLEASPDGTRIASGSLDKSVKVWTLPRPPWLGPDRLETDHGPIVDLVPSPDRTSLLVVSVVDASIWDPVEGRVTRQLPVTAHSQVAGAWSGDGSRIALADQTGRVRVLDAETGTIRHEIGTTSTAIAYVGFLDPNRLMTRTLHGPNTFWDLQVPPDTVLRDEIAGELVALDDDRRTLAIAGPGPNVRLEHLDDLSEGDGTEANGDQEVIVDTIPLASEPIALAWGGSETLAIATSDRALTCYRIDTGEVIGQVTDVPADLDRLALRGDGRQAVAGFEDGRLLIYRFDGDSSGPGRALRPHDPNDPIRALVYLRADPSLLISASSAGVVRIHHLGPIQLDRDLGGHEGTLEGLAVDPEQLTLGTASSDGRIRSWNLVDGSLQATVGPFEPKPLDIMGVPGRPELLARRVDGSVTLIDPAAGVIREVLTEPETEGTSTTLLGTDADSLIFRTRAGELSPLKRRGIHTPRSMEIEVALVETEGGTIRLIRSTDGQQLKEFDPFEADESGVSITTRFPLGDRARYAVGTSDGRVALIGAEGLIRTWTDLGGPITDLDRLDGPDRILAASGDGTVRVLGIEDGSVAENTFGDPIDETVSTQITALDTASGPVLGLATGGPDVTLLALEPGPGPEDSLVPATYRAHEGQVYGLAWSPDGSTLYTAGSDANVKVWDTANSNEMRSIQAHEGVAYDVDVRIQGDLVATSGSNGIIKFWNPQDGKELRKGEGHEGAIYSLRFSPDGARLASGSIDKTIRLWNAEDATLIRTLSGHPDDPYQVVFTHDGTRLVSVGYGGHVFVWDLSIPPPEPPEDPNPSEPDPGDQDDGETADAEETNPSESTEEPDSEPDQPILARHRLPVGTLAHALAIDHEDRRVAVAASDGKVYLFQLPDIDD